MENELFEKWGEIKGALLEGLDKKQAAVVGPLLENQKNQMLYETAASGSVGADSIAGFRKILIPMIRRIIPGTIAMELVGVQPMSGPVGLVYSLRYKYAEALTATQHNNGAIDHGVGDITLDSEAFGNINAIRRFYSGAASDGGVTTRGRAQDAGAGGMGAPAPSAIEAANASGNAWGSTLDSTNYVLGQQASAAGAYNVGGVLHGGSGSFMEGSGGRKMSLEVISQAVEAGSRKLQAGWTIEAMQDLQSQHGLDLENEMTQALSAEIVQEIDNEVINDLLALAGTVGVFDGSLPGAPGYYRPTFVGDRLANLGVQINVVANEIARKTRRGAGNFIVVSPMIVSVLQTASKSVWAPATTGSFKGPNNTMLAGTLNSSIKVYTYLWNQVSGTNVSSNPSTGYQTGNDLILVGYKGGNGETDTGYFYCPYIPLMSSGVVINPVTFQPVVSLMTRYGKTSFTSTATSLGNSADYYGKVTVNNLTFA
jgi:hypothetical protein